MKLKRFIRHFRRLQWKLTLSYTITSVVTFLLIEVLFIGSILTIVIINVPTEVASSLQQEAPNVTPYFVHGRPDREALSAWMSIASTRLSSSGPLVLSQPVFLCVVDTQGRVIASTDSHAIPPDTLIQTHLSPQSQANLATALQNNKSTKSFVQQETDGTLVAISPIVSNQGRKLGALVMRTAHLDIWQPYSSFLQFILFTMLVVTTIAGIAGMVFGYLTARGLTRRLKSLSTVADKWSQGNFSELAHDNSADELGQTARKLNHMAEQLQNLFQVRQQLATIEERNRLARDLHDSVKQQIFAAAMMIGATKVLLKRDVNAAEGRLNEAQKLVSQARQELTSLIRELRPVALDGKGLIAALRELTTQWAEQTGIVANVRIEGSHSIPLSVEEALFRIAQEALSNVARHSKATLVQLTLTITDEQITLSIVDNGQGFDTHAGSSGVGLLSMRERMKALDGDVQIESTPEKGTTVIARCRLPKGTQTVASYSGDNEQETSASAQDNSTSSV